MALYLLLPLAFKSLIHSETILVWHVKYAWGHIFFQMATQMLEHSSSALLF